MSRNSIGAARSESTFERYEPHTPTQREAHVQLQRLAGVGEIHVEGLDYPETLAERAGAGDACTVSILAHDAERAS